MGDDLLVTCKESDTACVLKMIFIFHIC